MLRARTKTPLEDITARQSSLSFDCLQLIHFIQRTNQRFFTNDVCSMFERLDTEFKMRVGRCTNMDKIRPLFVEHDLRIGIGIGNAMFLAKSPYLLRVNVDGSNNLDALAFLMQGSDMIVCDHAGTQESGWADGGRSTI